ncbi:amidase [Rubrobacter tropicus]|uniref:Amidase n=1 Tax=Rubrobacter tropicus TaxID=2653851 RepID=A0A6G8QD37_9ACTN|nr:amidase [Rubrobacter tropicus]QIN84348.1 amidase [Rubrobacter tropicus]
MTASSFRLQEATIDDIHSAFRSGELTCRGLVELYLARIEAYDKNGPELNSILTVNPNVLDEADELDSSFGRRGEFVGPLHGIPVLVKDQAETAGIRTTFGSVAFEDYVPEEDATAVGRLKEAGALILAKTNLPDFATSWFAYSSAGGETKNPYDLDRDPGGSSGGTGAAVAANLGAVGIGEDTGGSIRVPSSFDNLVGFRVTTGLISRKGMSPLVVFQDTAGPMTRTVKDAAILLDALVGYDPADPFTAAATLARGAGGYAGGLSEGGLRGARVGVLREAFGPDDDPDSGEVNRVVGVAIEAMRDAGAEVVDPVSVPNLMGFIEVTSLYLSQSRYDIDGFLSTRPGSHTVGELYDAKRFHPRLDLFTAIAEEAPEHPEEDPNYHKGLAAREEFRRAILGVMASHNLDAILFPNSQVLPPTRKELDDWKWTVLTFPTNALIAAQADLPSVSLPAGFSEGGVPVGFELVGKPYGEADLLGLAHSYEKAADPRRSPDSVPPLPDEPR